jgi:hypothetical protein
VAVVEPARPEPGYWAGAPSALVTGTDTWLAYRERDPLRRGGRVVLAHSHGGERFDPVVVLDQERFGAESLERPALVRTDAGWRIYVCCATPASKHWWIDALDAPEPVALADADAQTVFGGDERTGVKDPVVRRAGGRWEAWICCHPLDVPGEEDRMTTAYATSADGLAWDWHGTVLAPRPGAWDARGTRVTAILPDGRAYYDGRAGKEENFSERTGLAEPAGGGRLRTLADAPVAGYRYLAVLGDRLYYDAPLPGGSHELRTELSGGGP